MPPQIEQESHNDQNNFACLGVGRIDKCIVFVDEEEELEGDDNVGVEGFVVLYGVEVETGHDHAGGALLVGIEQHQFLNLTSCDHIIQPRYFTA